MVERTLTSYLRTAFKKYPVLTITGPRQSGKTTLVKNTFPNLPYVNFENIETRQAAQTDPKAFIKTYENGAIIDEFQHMPELTYWIQVHTDEKKNSVNLRKCRTLIRAGRRLMLMPGRGYAATRLCIRPEHRRL